MRTFVKVFAAAAAIAMIAAPARADFTPIGTPPGSEPTIDTILNTLYGAGSFTGVDWSNGTVTATRVHDYVNGGDPISPGADNNLLLNGGNDQIWTDGVAAFQGRARFAGYSQMFGIDYGTNGAAGPDGLTSGIWDQQLLNVVGSGYDGALSGTLSAGFNFTPGDRWGWYRDGTTTNFSAASFNPDARPNYVGSDHMITYEITGLAEPEYSGQTVWLLFWDDQTSPLTDRDFNDLVVEVSASVVPVPGALFLGALGLGIVGYCRRWLV